MEIEVRPRDAESYDLLVEFDIGVGTGIVDTEKLDEHDVQLLARTVPATRLKLNEADFFLKMMKRYFRHEAATHFHFNAFVTALAGVLDVLPQEAAPARQREFRKWMEAKRRELKRNDDVSIALQFRNRSVHQGGHPPHLAFGLAFREHLDGDRTAEPMAEIIGLGGKPINDPLGVCERALAAMRDLVDEATSRDFIRPSKRTGHTIQLRYLKQASDQTWREVGPEEMDTFDGRVPSIHWNEDPAP